MFLTEISVEQKDRFEQYMDKTIDWLVGKAQLLVFAIIFLFFGFKISKFIAKVLKKSMDRHNVEKSVSGFMYSFIKGTLYMIIFIMAASIVGLQVTSLVAIFGTASLAIGLALQGSLANFAGGVLILIMKPFKVGDYIIENSKGLEGTVVTIDIFYTKLRTYDNRIVVIPNGCITANSIVNLTTEQRRKLDISICVSYDSDIDKVKRVLYEIAELSMFCDNKEDIEVFLSAFEDSSIKMGLRFYVLTEKYWNAKWTIQEEIKKKFDENNIIIPYNQLEVSLKKDD